MYNQNEYNNLISQYGAYASWAIWDHKDQKDPSIISQNIDHLHSRFILLGLSISRPLKEAPWSNFHHGPSNVRKLKYACNDTILRGSYITDIFKGIVEPASSKFSSAVTEKIIRENVNFFSQEMQDIRINDESQFIVFGAQNSLLARYFNKYFRHDRRNRIIYHYHYSYYGLSDEVWVESLWAKLGMDEDFDLVIRKYKKA